MILDGLNRKHTVRIPSWFPYLVGVVSLIVILSFWWRLRTLESTRIDLETQAEARSISAKIYDDLNHRAHSLERMQSRWKEAGGTPRKQWEADADLYILHHPGWRALEWVDTQYIVRWVRPLENNRQAVGLDLTFEEGRRKTLLEVRDTNKPLMTPAVDLVQGGVGSLMFHPLTAGDTFGGFLLTVFDLEKWLEYIINSEDRPFSIRVFMNNREVYQSPDNRNEWALRHMQSSQWQAQASMKAWSP